MRNITFYGQIFSMISIICLLNTVSTNSKTLLTKENSTQITEIENTSTKITQKNQNSVCKTENLFCTTYTSKKSTNKTNLQEIQGDGVITHQERKVQSFDTIRSIFPIEVIYTQSQDTVIMRGEKNIIDQFTVEIKDKELSVVPRNNITVYSSFKSPITVIVGLNNKEKIAISGMTICDLRNIETKKFTVIGNGNARIKGTVTSDYLEIIMSGNAYMQLEGKVAKQEIKMSGNSDYIATKLDTKKIYIKASGNSHAELCARSSIKGCASGCAQVIYHGDVVTTAIKQNGLGQFKKG